MTFVPFSFRSAFFIDADQYSRLAECDYPAMGVPVITAAAIPQHNHLLAALSAEVRDRIYPYLRLISLPRGAVLYRSGERPRHACFPVDSVVVLLHTLANGASTEISLVGSEGLTGITSVLGGESTHEAVVLRAGFAWELPMQQLKDEFDRNGDLLRMLLRYAQSLMTQVAQTAVCNRHHSIDQQLCSWLLFALDRLPGNRLAVTQELIANMLGVRRESITGAAVKLQRKGVLAYCRGHVTVLDRSKLEQLACECYALVKKEAARLQPDLIRVRPSRPAPRSFALPVPLDSLPGRRALAEQSRIGAKRAEAISSI